MRYFNTPMITMARFGTSTQATVSSGWRSLKKRVPPQFRLHAVAAGGEGADGTSGW